MQDTLVLYACSCGNALTVLVFPIAFIIVISWIRSSVGSPGLWMRTCLTDRIAGRRRCRAGGRDPGAYPEVLNRMLVDSSMIGIHATVLWIHLFYLDIP